MPPVTGRYPTIGDDYEAELARREAASEVTRGASHPSDEHQALIRQQAEELGRRLALIEEQAKAIEGLHRELVARLGWIERQAEALREARVILLLVSESRVYRVMRVLGRWGWLGRRIHRALQEPDPARPTTHQRPGQTAGALCMFPMAGNHPEMAYVLPAT